MAHVAHFPEKDMSSADWLQEFRLVPFLSGQETLTLFFLWFVYTELVPLALKSHNDTWPALTDKTDVLQCTGSCLQRSS